MNFFVFDSIRLLQNLRTTSYLWEYYSKPLLENVIQSNLVLTGTICAGEILTSLLLRGCVAIFATEIVVQGDIYNTVTLVKKREDKPFESHVEYTNVVKR